MTLTASERKFRRRPGVDSHRRAEAIAVPPAVDHDLGTGTPIERGLEAAVAPTRPGSTSGTSFEHSDVRKLRRVRT